MEWIGVGLLLSGLGLALVGGVWQIIVAFQESILWGLLCIFLAPISTLIFSILYFRESRYPLLLQFGGACLAAGGLFILLAGGATLPVIPLF